MSRLRGCYIGMGPRKRDCPWWAWALFIGMIIAVWAYEEWKP